MVSHSKGIIAYLCVALEDPLDTMLSQYQPRHREASQRLGFADPVVEEQVWTAAALSKAAIYDQFYTFACWAFPTLCNFYCLPHMDITHLEERMVDGTAAQMTCGPWCCNDPKPTGACLDKDYDLGRHDELIIIASCPGDKHAYYAHKDYNEFKALYGEEVMVRKFKAVYGNDQRFKQLPASYSQDEFEAMYGEDEMFKEFKAAHGQDGKDGADEMFKRFKAVYGEGGVFRAPCSEDQMRKKFNTVYGDYWHKKLLDALKGLRCECSHCSKAQHGTEWGHPLLQIVGYPTSGNIPFAA